MGEPAAPPAEAPRGRRPSLPDQRTLLTWLFLARLGIAVVALFRASLVWTDRPELAFIVSVVVLFALVLTVYGAWYVVIRNHRAGVWFLQVQSLADLTLVTMLMLLAGTAQSVAPALFVLVIAAYAVLLPFGPGILVTLAASALFLGAAFRLTRIDDGIEFWAQIVVFILVFTSVAVLGQRLRQAGVEQETLEHELQRVRLEADDILRNIRSGVLTVDGTGRLAFVNPTAERLLQLQSDRYLGRPVLHELQRRSPELWAAIASGIRHGRKVSRGEGTVEHDDGRRFPIGLSTTAFEQPAQSAPSVTAIFTDISDSKQLQELHLRAERLEAVAALSASLAHEIRNPLASIRSSVEQLARTQYATEDERFLSSLIVRESDRLSRLLSEFLDFSRVRATEFVPVDLHAVAVAAVRLVQAHPDCPPEAELVVEGDRTMLAGDEDLLHRIVANLVLNAVQAARGAVKVTVSVGRARTAELPAGANVDRPVRLRVADTGPGIPAEIREHLFQPFVSGRPGGSGLGLAIVQRAVEAHRGLVLVDSGPAPGTTFTVYLPAAWKAEDAA